LETWVRNAFLPFLSNLVQIESSEGHTSAVARTCGMIFANQRSSTREVHELPNLVWKPMNRRDLVLAMLACADGRAYTPVQIQKAIFIACDKTPALINQGPAFQFEPYDYGPFDAAVYGEIHALSNEGFATVAPSGGGRWNTYAASDIGLANGREILDGLAERDRGYLKQISEWVRSQSFSSLVKSIYEAYPSMRANSIFRG
jgi:hypothetical protein